MLAQSSDHLEDVIDMSSDNLARLKEEAQMAPMDKVIRYIRLFSELSGQIRYASQKRILVEIALIKLCKPSMETNREALLDRIREIEEKLEKGVVTVAAGAASEGVQGISAESAVGTGYGRRNPEKAELPKAIPEDIKEIVAKWPSIAANAENPMRQYLKGARLSLGNENNLIMVLEDGLASDYFSQHPENKEVLQQLLAEFCGKEVAVTIQTVSTVQEFEQNYVDLSQIIHMDIEEEE